MIQEFISGSLGTESASSVTKLFFSNHKSHPLETCFALSYRLDCLREWHLGS